MTNKISVILPTYNERENIIPLIERTVKAIPQ
jgi:glycosyltransferase involved in cell wall biosynthesis